MSADGRLEFDTGIETNGFETGLKNITKLIEKISKTVENVANNVKNIVKNTQTSTSALNDTVEKTNKNIENTSNEMRSLSSSSDTAAKELDSVADSAENAEDEVHSLGNASEKTSNKNDEFKKSVSNINQELKVLDSEMKLVKSQYDKNDTSSEALTAQNKVLNDSIEMQKQKIDVLKQALENSSEEYGENDKKTQEWKIQLNNAETALSNMERSLKNNNDVLEKNAARLSEAESQSEEFGDETGDTSNEVEDLGDQSKTTASEVENLGDKADKTEGKFSALKSISSKLKDSLSKLAEIAGVVITEVSTSILSLGTASTNVGSDFEASMSKVSAISKTSGDELDKLTEKAKEMGATTKFSATESAEAFQFMSMAGWDADDMLNGIDGIMSLSAADGLDLATTSDIVTDALTAFGLSADKSSHFADVLATASSSANTNVSMLGESFKYVAPLAGAMKYDVEDVSLALGLMANSSVKGSMAGTSLKTALANLTSPTTEMQKALKKLGLAASETSTEFDQLAIDKALTNQKKATQKLAEAQEKYSETVRKYGQDSSEAQKAATTLESAQNSLADANKKLTKAQQGTEKQTGFVVTAIQNADGSTKPLRETIIELRKAFANLDEAQQTEYASTIFGKEAMSGMLAIINASDDDFNKLVDNLDNADGAAKAMADTMNDNLQGDITIMNSALEGLGIKFYETFDDKLRSTVKLGTGYIDELSSALTNGGIQGAAEKAGEIFGDISIKIAEYAPEMINAAISFIQSFAKGIYDNRSQIITSLESVVETVQESLLEILPSSVRTPVKKMVSDVEDTLKGIVDVFKNTFTSNDIKNAVDSGVRVVGKFVDVITDTVKNILPSFQSALNRIKKALESDGFNKGIKTARDIVKTFGTIVSNVSKVALKLAADAIEKISDNLDILVPLALAAVTAFKAWKIISSVISWGNTLSKTISTLSEAITAESIAQDIARMRTEGATAAMGLQQIAAGLLTGKITLHEAATWLAAKAQAAFNAVMDANPVVLVVTAVAALVAGLTVLTTWLVTSTGEQANYVNAAEKMKEQEEKTTEKANDLADALSNIGDSSADFINGIDNAKSSLENIDDSIIIDTKKCDDLKTNMTDLQKDFNEIAGTYSDKRKELTQEEIDQLEDLFEKMRNVANEQLQLVRGYQTAATTQAQLFVEQFSGSVEEYIEQSKSYIKGATEAKDKVVQAAEEAYKNEVANIGKMKNLTKEERKQKLDAAKKSYDDAVKNANKEYSDTLSIVIDGYNSRTNAAYEFLEEANQYNQSYLNMQNEYNKKLVKIGSDTSKSETERKEQQEKLTTEYYQNQEKLIKDFTDTLDEEKTKQLGVWLGMVKNVQDNGGKIDQETANMVFEFLRTMDTLPPESQERMQSTIDSMKEVYDKLPDDMKKTAEKSSDAWIEGSSKLPERASSLTSKVKKEILDKLGEIPEGSKKKANEMIDSISTSIVSGNNLMKIDDAVQLVRDTAINGLSAKELFEQCGKNMLQGYLNGLNGDLTAPFTAGANITNQTLNGINMTADMHSPSRKTRKQGEYMVEGFTIGINESRKKAVDAAVAMTSETVKTIGDGLNKNIAAAKISLTGDTSGVFNMLKSKLVNIELTERLKSAVVQRSASIGNVLTSQTVMPQMSAGYEGKIAASGNIETHINIDGREFAVVTAPFIDEELAFLR